MRKKAEQTGDHTGLIAMGQGLVQEEYYGFYCEVCDKDFRTENQKKNHEQSEKHKKMIKQLIEEVALDDEAEQLKD